MSGADTNVTRYEPPQLAELGTFHQVTLSGGGDLPCIFGKTIGSPDYFQRIPITNCS
jgi:hypothetical protein